MTHGTSQQDQQPTPAAEPLAPYYWIASIEKPNGDRLHCHATADIVPGTQARGNAVKDILAFLEKKHGAFALLFFSLEPNEISALPRPAGA